MVGQFAGEKDEQSFEPALVEIEEALMPGFHHREAPGRTVHCIRLIQSYAHGRRNLYSSARTGASCGGAAAQGHDLRDEVGSQSS